MAFLRASGLCQVVGSVVASEKVQLAQMGLYLVWCSIQKQLLLKRCVYC